jgi:hypothetical protein
MYMIALNNGRCSCTWDYATQQDGSYAEFITEQRAVLWAEDNLGYQDWYIVEV